MWNSRLESQKTLNQRRRHCLCLVFRSTIKTALTKAPNKLNDRFIDWLVDDWVIDALVSLTTTLVLVLSSQRVDFFPLPPILRLFFLTKRPNVFGFWIDLFEFVRHLLLLFYHDCISWWQLLHPSDCILRLTTTLFSPAPQSSRPLPRCHSNTSKSAISQFKSRPSRRQFACLIWCQSVCQSSSREWNQSIVICLHLSYEIGMSAISEFYSFHDFVSFWLPSDIRFRLDVTGNVVISFSFTFFIDWSSAFFSLPLNHQKSSNAERWISLHSIVPPVWPQQHQLTFG